MSASARELANNVVNLLDPLRKERRFTCQEVSDYFGISVETLRAWRAQGRISYLRHGQKVLFTIEHVREYEARTTVKANR